MLISVGVELAVGSQDSMSIQKEGAAQTNGGGQTLFNVLSSLVCTCVSPFLLQSISESILLIHQLILNMKCLISFQQGDPTIDHRIVGARCIANSGCLTRQANNGND